MNVKLSGQWVEAISLTRELSEVIDSASKALEQGYQVCIVAVEAVEVDDNKTELLTIELD